MDPKIMVLVAGLLLSALLFIILVPSFMDSAPSNSDEEILNTSECGSDMDCGVSAFTGFYTCRDDQIYGEYLTRLCIQDKNLVYKCVEIRSMEFIQTCFHPDKCVPGLSDCEMETTTTYATIVLPTYTTPEKTYMATTSTTLSDVTCVRNSSCGIDHFGKPYCTTSGHSVRDYITYKCHNPGTYSSRCTREKKTYLVDYCGVGEACIQGECVNKNNLEWYCIRDDCCATDFSLCGDYSVQFLPFPIRGLHNETYYLDHNMVIHP